MSLVVVRALFFSPFFFFLHVSLHVQREVVRPGESSLAQVTLEGPVSGMFPEVSRQLVRACELPAAAFPTAMVRLLT